VKLLSSSLLLARIRGMEIRLHFSVLFSIPIAYYLFHPTDLNGVALASLWLAGFVLCVLLHELGHALAAKLVGVEVKSIVIWLLGGFTRLGRVPEKPQHRLLISAAGPLVSLAIGLSCIAVYLVFPAFMMMSNLEIQAIRLFLSLGIINLMLFVFNLLPIYPLDGGNILHALMETFFGKSNANWITMLVGIPLLLCLFALGVYMRDYFLLATCVLLTLALGTLNRSSLHWISLRLSRLLGNAAYLYMQGDYERAARAYTRDIERVPDHPDYYLGRAACLLNLMQKERALADVERALRITPDYPIALELRGEIYLMEKKYGPALENFAHAQELTPNWSVPHFDRGSVLLEQKEFQAALAEFNTAFSLPLQLPLYYVVRSMTHFRLGNIESAHDDQDAAIRLSEKDALVMAEVNMQIYDDYLDWAEDYYTRVIARQPRLGYAWQGRADAYLRNKEYDKALADYTHAIELMPKEPCLYLGRGKVHQAKGEVDSAMDDFRRALVLADKLHLQRQAEDFLKNVAPR
jgi:Zn-dependent protease/Tfp pilus assembly protein PilF